MGFLLASVAWSGWGAPVQLSGDAKALTVLSPYLPKERVAAQRLRTTFAEILATEGYFSPTLNIDEQEESLNVAVILGPKTQIRSLALSIDGVNAVERVNQLKEAWLLPVNADFRQAQWTAAKESLLAQLVSDDYADASLAGSEASIDADEAKADLFAHYVAGPPYRFGAMRVIGLYRFSPELVARYNRVVREGAPYRERELNALQSALQGTPYFSSARVTLDREHALENEDGSVTAPVLVDVSERAAHKLGFGAGASSNTGARVEANYSTPDFFGRAWLLDSGLRLEQKKQTAFADVFLPPDHHDRRLGFGVMAESSDISSLQTERLALGAQSVQQRGNVEQRMSLTYETERRLASGVEAEISHALVPNVTWKWRHVDNLLDPRRGMVLQGKVGGGAKAALSDENFLRLYTRGQFYWPWGKQDMLSFRAEFGATLARSTEHIPQDYLFRAGGTGSVRGYAYESLGIKEGSSVLGGQYLATMSLEATHWMTPEWGMAAFVDMGDASNSVKTLSPAVGYGVGARWKSPAGPIGVDIAYGQQVSGLQLHFALAIPF